MSKRNKLIIETAESKALRKLRTERGVSLRELGRMMEISSARVHQFELGRDNINEDYISRFLKCLNVSIETWNKELRAFGSGSVVKDECISLLDQLSEEQVVLLVALIKV